MPPKVSKSANEMPHREPWMARGNLRGIAEAHLNSGEPLDRSKIKEAMRDWWSLWQEREKAEALAALDGLLRDLDEREKKLDDELKEEREKQDFVDVAGGNRQLVDEAQKVVDGYEGKKATLEKGRRWKSVAGVLISTCIIGIAAETKQHQEGLSSFISFLKGSRPLAPVIVMPLVLMFIVVVAGQVTMHSSRFILEGRSMRMRGAGLAFLVLAGFVWVQLSSAFKENEDHRRPKEPATTPPPATPPARSPGDRIEEDKF